MWDTIGELWIKTRIETTLRYVVLCLLTLVTRKLQVVYGRSIYRMTALLSQIPIFCVRAGFEIQMACYASKHVSQYKPFFYEYSVLRRITWNFRSYVNAHHIEWLLYYRRHSLCVLDKIMGVWVYANLHVLWYLSSYPTLNVLTSRQGEHDHMFDYDKS